ncbi:hypothetical protein Ahy_Scaffold1g106649 isoform A [Arachis hypogaea]|uniref:Cytochrome P450 n=1 Tax=Arachis hypogaea TaxID=3818 RepID=A0A444WR13_ARAHY|nr:hypothetical protein Ahy_Scaffold1g106649 isoform A [Arachis hypogaea]
MWPLYLVALVIILPTFLAYRWKNPTCNGRLPPGSMGLPLVGETLQFFSPNTSDDISAFLKHRIKRYGSIFKTNLVGRPVVVSTDPDLNYFIFQQEGQVFQSCLKKMISEVEHAACTYLQHWSCQDTVELKEATATMIFDFTAKKLISYDSKNSSENLRENFVAFIQGLISFPLDLPGTAYHKCLQGRKKAMKMLKKMLEERKANPRKEHSDFFDYVVEEVKKEGTILTEAIALDLMFVLLFASFETTSLAITYAFKVLSHNPLVLKQLQEEHESILKRRKDPNSGVTWKEYKSMTYTFQFINETVRLANIAPGIFRKALREINFKGYTIPAGWGVMVCPPAVHLSPAKYQDPLSFNPSRWEGIELNGATRQFMAFGGGMRFCVGADFSKVQMAVFIHCLVTKYRWNPIKGGNIIRTPGLQFPDGFHVQMIKNDQSNQESECTITT